MFKGVEHPPCIPNCTENESQRYSYIGQIDWFWDVLAVEFYVSS